tara:strand:- start:697 stop:894 length:198 start_codon:yes stop_codon:yes gene_type:complete
MALSEHTTDHLLEAESHLRAALKSAAMNERPIVIHQLSRLITDIEGIETFDSLQDAVEEHTKKES